MTIITKEKREAIMAEENRRRMAKTKSPIVDINICGRWIIYERANGEEATIRMPDDVCDDEGASKQLYAISGGRQNQLQNLHRTSSTGAANLTRNTPSPTTTIRARWTTQSAFATRSSALTCTGWVTDRASLRRPSMTSRTGESCHMSSRRCETPSRKACIPITPTRSARCRCNG